MSQMGKEGFGEEFSICSSFCFGRIGGGIQLIPIPRAIPSAHALDFFCLCSDNILGKFFNFRAIRAVQNHICHHDRHLMMRNHLFNESFVERFGGFKCIDIHRTAHHSTANHHSSPHATPRRGSIRHICSVPSFVPFPHHCIFFALCSLNIFCKLFNFWMFCFRERDFSHHNSIVVVWNHLLNKMTAYISHHTARIISIASAHHLTPHKVPTPHSREKR